MLTIKLPNKALEPLRQVLDLDSYTYLAEVHPLGPYFLEAIEHALKEGLTPDQIRRYIEDNTGSHRQIGLTCEQAARHLQQRANA